MIVNMLAILLGSVENVCLSEELRNVCYTAPKYVTYFGGVEHTFFLAPTAVKHTFFIDPSRIAVQNSHIMLINMW